MIIQARNPRISLVPEIQALFQAAIAHSPWEGNPGAMTAFVGLVSNPKAGVFLGQEDGWKALGIVLLPSHPLDNIPQVIHLYNIGTPSLRRELTQYIVDFIHKGGYNRFLAVNYSGKPDKIWAKVMQTNGWESKPIGSIVEFNHVRGS